MNKRLFLLVVIFVLIGGGAFIGFRPNPKRQIEKAFSCVMKGQYVEAEGFLATQPLPIYTALYRGYLEQQRGRFEIAGRHFQTAYREATPRTPREIQCQIALAQAANHFCKGDVEEFRAQVQMASLLHSDSLILPFFKGLEHYTQGSYSDALHLWNTPGCDASDKWMTDKWMISSLETLFPSCWRKLHVAHCLIEVGDLVSAREIIEKESRLSSPGQDSPALATLLLGLSYLQEAGQASIDQRASYYKLARFYFERVKFSGQLLQEKECAISHIEHTAGQLLSIKMNPEQRKWGFDFIHILQDWKAEKSLENLANCLSNNLLHHKGETSVLLCTAIREEFHGSPFHLMLTEKMLAALTRDVKAGEVDDLFNLWAHVEQLAPSPLMAARRIASLTSDEIFETIKKDGLSLYRTRNFLAFWEKLGRTPFEREVLARDLLAHAKTFWYYEQQEKKGQNLMEIALHLSNRNTWVEKEISLFLTTLFKQAEDSNMIGRLLLVYEAMGHFDMNRQELVSKSTLANHLADAEYLYRVHNYLATKTHAGWVLTLDPQNEGALRLVGLASFQLGEYGQALVHLQKVSLHDEATHEALMLSRVFASQDQAKHLCQTDPSSTYETNQ